MNNATKSNNDYTSTESDAIPFILNQYTTDADGTLIDSAIVHQKLVMSVTKTNK